MNKRLILGAAFLGLAGASSAQFWTTKEPVRLGGEVNTAADESIPVFSKDSATLYFVRTYDASNVGGEEDQDIWYSKRNSDGTYGQCAQLTKQNNKYNNGIVGINDAGTAMYVFNTYEGKKDLEKGIAVSKWNGSSWGSAEKVEVPGLDIEGDFYGFHVAGDESVMFISHAGPGTLGQEDLYVSTKSGGSWSAPQHMGSTINTTGYEISPFLSKTKDTLYFASNGHGGLGDADIFYSIKQGSWTSWSKPVNLGDKINSAKFDAYFTHNGSMCYWSSNRASELSDIYLLEIDVPPLTAMAKGTDVTVYQGTDGKLDGTPEGGVAPYTFLWSNGSTEEDPINVPKGEYTFTVTDALGQVAKATAVVGEPGPPQDISLKHYFTYNAHELSTTEGELNNFVTTIEKQLASGRDMVTVTVNSSASKVRTRTFSNNEKLAKRRADDIKKVLEDYFKSKSLDAKVKVEIKDVLVQGPDYNGDFEDTKKYEPFQYIELQTK